MFVILPAILRRRSTTLTLSGITIRSGSKVPFSSSTPILFLGRSFTWPMDASTTKSLPRYFPMDFALAGDSTITSDLLIASLHFRLLSIPAADLPVRLVLTTLLFRRRGNMLHRSPAISERYSIFPTMGGRSESRDDLLDLA